MAKLSVQIRQAEPADAPVIHQLHTRSVRTLCQTHYTPSQIEGWLGRRQPEGYLPAIQRHELFVAEVAGVLVGFGHAVPGEIVAIFVDSDWAGHGVGRQLVDYAMPLAQGSTGGPVHLEATLNACGFYARYGFQHLRQKLIQRGQVELAVVEMVYHG